MHGYLDFLQEHQLKEHVFCFESFEHTLALKNRKIKRILEEETIDSLFCTDDLTALLVINNCRELNRAIPEDLKLIGYDGTRFVRSYFPHLTTIVQPIDELAELLVALLIQRITKPDKQLEASYKLPVKVSQGQTT